MSKTPEITGKGIILAIILSVILSISNVYLALKIGILISASIPAAIISMGVLRLFKQSSILENNLVQTGASAGEAVAGGIGYTIPALIIIHYWTAFSYWHCFFIALIGGSLGIMFSIPLRRVLMTNATLKFPEGRAIAEVLQATRYQQGGVREVVMGGVISALLEFFQTGIKIFAASWEAWFKVKNTVLGFGIAFSPAMIGAGYLIGIRLTASIFIGAILSWFCSIPLLGYLHNDVVNSTLPASQIAQTLWGNSTRYIGIGAMLMAGLMILATLIKPMLKGMHLAWQTPAVKRQTISVARTEADMPLHYIILISVIGIIGLYFLYQYLFPLEQLGLSSFLKHGLFYSLLLYTLVAGFILSVITAYFSGMIGVSASPGSAVIIASLLLVAILIATFLQHAGYLTLNLPQIKASEAITIICTSIIGGMVAISNDNMQDLKVGHILGATPWKQQVMLLLGVVVASLVIAFIMQVLFSVYGIAQVMPHSGMDPSLSLPAPPAAAMAVLSEAVFQKNIPWQMLLVGVMTVFCLYWVNVGLRNTRFNFSILGVAIGIYLPLASSTSLFLGGLFAWYMQRKQAKTQHDILFACGLIAGASLLDVLLAIPFSLLKNPNALNLAPLFWTPIGISLSLVSLAGLFAWFYRIR